MNDNPDTHNQINVTVHGPVDRSQMAAGYNIQQHQVLGGKASVLNSDEIAQLETLVASLRAEVAKAPDLDEQTREEGTKLVDELGAATTATKPDLSKMEHVLMWFQRHIPALAGGVMSVVVNPIVGKLVSAAGEAVVAEFSRRFNQS